MASSTSKRKRQKGAWHPSRSPAQTRRLGAQIAKQLKPGDVVALTGAIGAGKTTFVKGLAQGLGVPADAVSSPSFVLVREYSGRIPLYHADLFRLEGLPEAMTVGLEEYYEAQGVTVIEWGMQIPAVLPNEFLEICFKVTDSKTRQLKLIPHGVSYRGKRWA